MKFFHVCGVPVSSINIPLACEIIDQWIKERKKTYVCVAPVSTIVDAQSDPQYFRILTQADMVTPDGMPVVWVGKLKGEKNLSRTYGPDLMQALCDRGQSIGYRHYLYGGSQNACNLLENALKRMFPKINIVGRYSPPFVPGFVKEDAKVIDQINQSRADILWVGLGSPKQDYWMSHHRELLNVPVILGVGAAFDFIAGTKKQAPKWMQRTGLEWFFRLCCEPKRLWRRYLIGNTKFLYYLLADCFISKKRTK